MISALHGQYKQQKCFMTIKKKTIYYDNAVIKIYDIPIFYFPKLSHPDPTVDRRSGFLPPSFSDSKNLGSGITIPYFYSFGKIKNFTVTNKFYASEHPLILGEYHKAFKKFKFFRDFGFTQGYKNTSDTKKEEKSHFFSKFTKILILMTILTVHLACRYKIPLMINILETFIR